MREREPSEKQHGGAGIISYGRNWELAPGSAKERAPEGKEKHRVQRVPSVLFTVQAEDVASSPPTRLRYRNNRKKHGHCACKMVEWDEMAGVGDDSLPSSASQCLYVCTYNPGELLGRSMHYIQYMHIGIYHGMYIDSTEYGVLSRDG